MAYRSLTFLSLATVIFFSPLAWSQQAIESVAAGDFTTLTYANVFENAIKQSCLGCHSAPNNRGKVNLESYAPTFAARADIADDVSQGFMPKDHAMDPQAKQLLLNWLAAGAPEGATL